MTARRLPFALVSLLCGAALSGQALTDHAAAIAGASAGVAGGKVVSDALTKILQSASDTTGTAATQPPKPDTKPAKKAQTNPAGVPAMAAAPFSPAPSAPTPPAWRRPGEPRPVLPVVQPSFSRYESREPARQVTSAQLRSVASGASRAEVIASLGIPAARITMDDNGHLVEILEYTANGSRVGSVRCSDGRVESVNTAER
ncbi:MAG: hypothetical protein ABSF98_06940 [Bryobacteraceae bacterium]|jgi:hypothetical protein